MPRLPIDIPNEFSISHSVSDIDENHLLYGNFIGLQYIFKYNLDIDCLVPAISKLVQLFPALAGKYDAENKRVIVPNEKLHLNLNSRHSWSIEQHVEDCMYAPYRREFVVEPDRRDVLAGRAPLATFTYTKLWKGGCVFGVAISHALTDAAGFHILMKRLADIYTEIAFERDPNPSPIDSHLSAFSFGTDRTKEDTDVALSEAGLKRPMKIRGVIGGLLQKIIIRAMEKITKNNRIFMYFSASDLTRLKQKVLLESGEDWISTNIALSAHFTKIMAMLMYGDKKKSKMQIGQLLDLRGRYFEEDRDKQDDFVGNAILIHTQKTEFPDGIQNLPRGELAKWFKQNLSTIDAEYLRTRLDLIADCLRQGNSYVGLELADPMIALNNQSKMPVYDLNFAGEVPVRVIPQDVGDNIMFFPTNDGGIEIYIRDILNPKRQQRLLTAAWQERVFDF